MKNEKVEMDLRRIKADELVERFSRFVASERKIMHRVVEYIAEIDRRKLYLARAYPSLFEMLMQEFGYSTAGERATERAAKQATCEPDRNDPGRAFGTKNYFYSNSKSCFGSRSMLSVSG